MKTNLKAIAQQVCDAVSTGTVDVDGSDKVAQEISPSAYQFTMSKARTSGRAGEEVVHGRYVYTVTVVEQYWELIDE